ncbi:MAG: formylglycine-generating enzyme family protein [Planctomycetota bacterium]
MAWFRVMSTMIAAGVMASGQAVLADDPPADAPDGMVWIPGGAFTMGGVGDKARQDELPRHRVRVDGFWIDRTEVTNAQFAQFVEATGYVTTAERPVDWEELRKQLPPGTPRPPVELLAAGSVVFAAPDQAVSLRDVRAWWQFTPGANWRPPTGPGSSIDGLDDHPVVHVSLRDVAAYAAWAGKDVPTEAEWEFAARGGLADQAYAWGDTLAPDGRHLANTFTGSFPHHNSEADGFAGLAPVGSFPANGYGVVDMIGNAWEWTADGYDPMSHRRRFQVGGVADNPALPVDLDDGGAIAAIRGGSHLCHASYCSSYRPSARMSQLVSEGNGHLGFRLIKRVADVEAEPGE